MTLAAADTYEADRSNPVQSRGKSTARRLTAVARIALGLPLFVNGLNGFLGFLPQPTPQLPERAMAFAGALAQSGYMLQLIAGTHLVVGLLLLANRFVPLALALLAPVLVNIVAFHVFLAPAGLAMPILLVAVEAYLAWTHRAAFAPMLRARVRPGVAAARDEREAREHGIALPA